MVSKALLVLGFLLVAVVLISSEVAPRELAENAEVEANDPVNAKQYHCWCCGRPWCRCCHYEGEVPDMKVEAEPHN